ncbi:MAG: hypothetical protein EXQ52_11490 [Bryobacterales bacterium]|nr:hypothetical protein [Bryobacterales bacterium]
MAKAKNTVWLAPGIPFQLEYAPEALEHVRRIAVEAFYSMPRGGMEVGGILLGRHGNGLVEVLNSVPIECEHASGPGFVLSPKDHTKLAALVAGGGRQPGGPELRVVGWFHSHTRSGIFLSAEDLAIHERYFPEPWQVALVVRPEHGAPARAGFFFRGTGGSIRSESTALEFKLQTLAHASPGAVWGAAAGIAPTSEPLPVAGVPDPVPEVETIESPPEPPAPVPVIPVVEAAPRYLLWLTLALGLVALIAMAGFVYRDTEVKVLREDIRRERLRARELERRLEVERKAHEAQVARPAPPAEQPGASQ